VIAIAFSIVGGVVNVVLGIWDRSGRHVVKAASAPTSCRLRAPSCDELLRERRYKGAGEQWHDGMLSWSDVMCSANPDRRPVLASDDPPYMLRVPRSASACQLVLGATLELRLGVDDVRPAATSAALRVAQCVLARLLRSGPKSLSAAWLEVRADAAARPGDNNVLSSVKRVYAIMPHTPASRFVQLAEHSAINHAGGGPTTASAFAAELLWAAHFLDGLMPGTVPPGLLFRATAETVLSAAEGARGPRAAAYGAEVRAALRSPPLRAAAAASMTTPQLQAFRRALPE